MIRGILRWFSIVLVACSSSLACARKAPGPKECQRVALEIIGVSDARLLRVARVKEAVAAVGAEAEQVREHLRCTS